LQIDLLENNEVVYRARGYFGAKSKSYDATTKKLVKEHPLRIRDILWNKWIYSKKYIRSEFMQ
jgi:transposase, IS5 family